jgi:hypothetical protein
MEHKDYKPNTIVKHNEKCLSGDCDITPQMYYTDLLVINTQDKSEIDTDWNNGIEDTFADYNTSVEVATSLLCEYTKPKYLVCVSIYELDFDINKQKWVLPTEHRLAFRCVNCPIELANKFNITDITLCIDNLYHTEYYGSYNGVEVDRGTWESAVCPICMDSVTDNDLDILAERLYFALSQDFKTDNLTEEQINSELRWKIEEDMIMSLPNTYYYEDVED